MVQRGVLDQTIIGIGLLFIINEVVTIIGYVFTKRFIEPNRSGLEERFFGESRLDNTEW